MITSLDLPSLPTGRKPRWPPPYRASSSARAARRCTNRCAVSPILVPSCRKGIAVLSSSSMSTPHSLGVAGEGGAAGGARGDFEVGLDKTRSGTDMVPGRGELAQALARVCANLNSTRLLFSPPLVLFGRYCWDGTRADPPGPVCNWRLLAGNQPRPHLSRARDYRGVNHEVWCVFVHRYGGRPSHHPCHTSAPTRSDVAQVLSVRLNRYGGYPPICRHVLDIYAPPAPMPHGA